MTSTLHVIAISLANTLDQAILLEPVDRSIELTGVDLPTAAQANREPIREEIRIPLPLMQQPQQRVSGRQTGSLRSRRRSRLSGLFLDTESLQTPFRGCPVGPNTCLKGPRQMSCRRPTFASRHFRKASNSR